MNEIYDALRTANANGDKASVAKLSDYINSQPAMFQAPLGCASETQHLGPALRLRQAGIHPAAIAARAGLHWLVGRARV
jgi:hypothetical protein